jgi:hypothetical protein
MSEIPESLLRRSAEAKAKALGVPVEEVLAEMKGEGPPIEIQPPEAEPEPVPEVPKADQPDTTPEIDADYTQDVEPEEPKEAEYDEEPVPEPVAQPEPAAVEPEPEAGLEPETEPEGTAEPTAPAEEQAAAVATLVEEEPASTGDGNGSGNGRTASVVTPRPSVPPVDVPEGVRTQRLLTVVKARAIQDVKAEPTDKVNTWPHLMLMEFGALLAISAVLIILSVIIFSPLLDPANVNSTPNPSKAPWYFLGLQELLSYFDPQIAGVTVPTITGIIGFMMVPFVDKNPSTRPSDRKFAILLFSMFMAGAATLTIFGVLFRGQGFNFSYPWQDGVFFDDLKDWVQFE